MNLQKLRLGQLKAAGTTVGDVYFPQTELLLPFDGSNGATATSDLSDNNHSVTFAGNAQISTAQSKFGGSSCYFDGTGDYLTMPSSSAFAFGTGNFTIEFWVRRTSTGSYPYLLDFRSGGTDAVVATLYLLHTDNYKPQYYVNGVLRIGSSVGLSVDTWYHIAIVRSSGTTTMYVDGSSAGSFSDSFTYIAAPLRVGDYSSGGHGFPGYVDDFRITNDIARYTSSFTPPTTAHSTSAGDVNKQILINETADGVAIGTGGINQARIAKVWVNFNGTGTIAIRDSYNVSSVSDNGTGDYTVNFSTAMSDTNYCKVGHCFYWGTAGGDFGERTAATGSLRFISIHTVTGSETDMPTNDVIVFGN
jgi:hypothetical protein